MSEFTEHENKKVTQLAGYIKGLSNNLNGITLANDFKIEETDFMPKDIVIAIDRVLKEEKDIEKLKKATNKLFHMLYTALVSKPIPPYKKIPFLKQMIADNMALQETLSNFKNSVKNINRTKRIDNDSTKPVLKELLNFCEHYRALQNILFPEIEKVLEEHSCLRILWSIQDDVVSYIKTLASERDLKNFNTLVGKIFFSMSTLIFREEYILYPLSVDFFDQETFIKMELQLSEFNLEYVNNITTEETPLTKTSIKSKTITFDTGTLTVEQLDMILKTLPVDVTFVDENDEVKFYSNPPERVFPRTPGIIGRKVQNCHPQESVDVVNKIIESFKNGEKDDVSFWIKMDPKYVFIKYFAIRDEAKHYRGVLEVTQEISDIQSIKGEKRLLDY